MSSYSYSLGSKCLSEFVAMTFTMLFGDGIIANELLPSTKGHGMGYLAVAIGFGLAFGVNIAFFGFVSAHLNPAFWFFLALVGRAPWTEFLACSCADFAGAFLGAILVYVVYLPHFGFSLPLPSNCGDSAIYIEGLVCMEHNAGRLASAYGPASRKPVGTTLLGEMKSFFHLPIDEHFLRHSHISLEDKELLEKMEQRHERRTQVARTAPPTRLNYFRSNSINLGTLGRERDPKDVVADDDAAMRHSVHVGGLLHTHDKNEFVEAQIVSKSVESATEPLSRTRDSNNAGKDDNTIDPTDVENLKSAEEVPEVGTQTQAYAAALQADAHAKLAIFSTRPAIFNRPFNFLQEAIATMVLCVGAEMLNLRRDMEQELTGKPFADGQFTKAILISLYITLLVLALGGPTGLAANPARDLGPRLAHQLLPIPGKGPSEWEYGFIAPGLGPMAGAAVGAALFLAMEALYNTVEIVETTTSGGAEL